MGHTVQRIVVILLTNALYSTELDTECRKDITFVMEYKSSPWVGHFWCNGNCRYNSVCSCNANCWYNRNCQYNGGCWYNGNCWHIWDGCCYCTEDFLDGVLDVSDLTANVHVLFNGHTYGYQLTWPRTTSGQCGAQNWHSHHQTLSGLLQVVSGNFMTGRPDVPDVIVLVAESKTLDVKDDVAKSLRDNGILVVVVGVGDDVNRSELLLLATDETYLLMVHDRLQLKHSIPKIREMACSSCQKDVTFVMAWDEVSPGRQSLGWCSGGLVSEFVKTIDNQLEVTSVDWLPDGNANGCQMNWRDFSTNCSCHKSQWPELSPSLLFENIINRFSNLRPEYPNVVVLITDRRVGFSIGDTQIFRDNNVLVVTVEIGNTGSQEELRALATSSNVSFTLENWSSLTGLIPELRHLVCHDSSIQPKIVACGDSRIDVTILVDLSHSMTGYVPSMKTFLTTFLTTLSVTDKDQHVTLITFSSNVKVVVENSVNISDLLAAINDLKPQMGVSDMSGALTEAFYVVKRSPRLYMDTGQSCPALAALILSDGLSQSRSDVLKAATNLKRVGVRISLLSFGVESTVYENEAITSNHYTFHSFNRSMNSTLLNELHSDIVNGTSEVQSSVAGSDCGYEPANVTFIFNVQSEDFIQTYVGEFVNFTKPLSNHPHISVLHPFHISSTLPNDVRSHKTVSSTLLEMLEEVKFPTDVNGATCVIIVSDEKVTAPAPLFRQIWRLADTGSKVMSVGVGDDVNNYVTERIASVPRYAFSSRSVWDIDIPQNMWSRYCEACGFTPAIDLVFLVEASTQTFSPWNDVLNFLIGASDNFPVGRHNVMVSVVTFGQQTVSQIRFNSYTNKMELFRSIRSLQPRRGPADLSTVLQDVDSLFAGARGGRPEAKKVAVLVMAQMITRVNSTGENTHVILLDIGDKINYSPSKFVKSSDIYIQTRGADDLARYSRDLRGIVCSNEP
ncbi:collagen alpha-4(VI) chain-like [Haliotis rufescens]|uniref:collagen alpha-4(VI) chain-like n=1 Tax=Haliotis rufescens TaxID=6454 RepID=UPI00201EE73E|nr:collagen alpha-4(VI) chain-like [Haliotis rufescens]